MRAAMFRLLSCWFVSGVLLGPAPAGAADLTATETRWLQGTWPVLRFARDAGLPVDIVVQPQPAAGLPPIALAFIGGRCKLVFSMRDNPEVQATVERTAPELLDAALQLMAAHELGHCQRHVSGAWRLLPGGIAAPPPDAGEKAEATDAGTRAAREEMQALRREEAYADLVGLAWVREHHAALYPRLHTWLVAERTEGRVVGGVHDTLAWALLAQRAENGGGRSIFAAADTLWQTGLREGH